MPGESWYSQLQPASFGGLRFKVTSVETSGGQKFSTEVQVGRGARPIRTSTDVDGHRFDAFLVGGDAIEQARVLIARLKQGQGTLVHPFFGAVEALPVRWSYRFQAGEVEFATVSLDFQVSTTTPDEEIEPGTGASTAEDARAAIVSRAADIDAGSAAGAALGEYAGLLGLDPSSDTFVTEAVDTLLANPGGPLAGLPKLLRDLGVSLDAAEEGTLEPEAASRIDGDLLLAAVRTDELAIMDMRQDFQLYLRTLGDAAIVSTVAGSGRLLPAVAVAEDTSLDRLAPRNRRAVADWFARGDVRL